MRKIVSKHSGIRERRDYAEHGSGITNRTGGRREGGKDRLYRLRQRPRELVLEW